MVLSSIFKSDFGTVGRGFESLWVRYQWERLVKPFLFFYVGKHCLKEILHTLVRPQPAPYNPERRFVLTIAMVRLDLSAKASQAMY
jgi:hypothetical protein